MIKPDEIKKSLPTDLNLHSSHLLFWCWINLQNTHPPGNLSVLPRGHVDAARKLLLRGLRCLPRSVRKTQHWTWHSWWAIYQVVKLIWWNVLSTCPAQMDVLKLSRWWQVGFLRKLPHRWVRPAFKKNNSFREGLICGDDHSRKHRSGWIKRICLSNLHSSGETSQWVRAFGSWCGRSTACC